MELYRLKPAAGSCKRSKRVGRGQGSGKGGTSTRGHKGGQSRSGYKRKFGFEGGQQPLKRRVPKYGFKSPNRIEYTPLNLSIFQALAQKHNVSCLDHFFLRKHRIVGKNEKYKILGKGELSLKLSISAHRCSSSALQTIRSLGGEVTILS